MPWTLELMAQLSREAEARMMAYDWPGNVRELANAIEHAVVLGTGSTIETTDLPSQIVAQVLPAVAGDNLSYREGVNHARKDLVLKALRKTDGNRAAAARLLGLETKYFLRLMKSLGIE